MEKLLAKLRHDYPQISFVLGDELHWSPQDKVVTYPKLNDKIIIWGLLHEVGHAILEHQTFMTDIDLLQKEVAAWHTAQALAGTYEIVIDQDHVEACLDTYRDWVHSRSTCPTCKSHGIEQLTGRYNCLNCHTTWEVSSSRFCRPYRRIRSLETKIAG